MRKKLQTKLLWLLLPPMVACVLFLGPLRGVGAAQTGADSTTATTTRDGLKIPETPGMMQIGSSLLGVLLLGVVGVMLLARMKGVRPLARTGDGTELMTLRQSLRLSGRHHVHAVEFDGRVLLLGECENQLSMLHSTDDPATSADEQNIRDRADDVGVDLRDTPTLPKAVRKKTTKKKKRTVKKAAPKPAAPVEPNEVIDAAAANLADFKTLLQRARKKANV